MVIRENWSNGEKREERTRNEYDGLPVVYVEVFVHRVFLTLRTATTHAVSLNLIFIICVPHHAARKGAIRDLSRGS